MLNSDNLTRQQALSLLPKLFFYLIGGFILAGIVGDYVRIQTLGEDINTFLEILKHPKDNLNHGMAVLLIQGASSIVIFFITPLFFIYRTNFTILYETGKNLTPTLSSYINIAIMMVLSLPLIGFLGEFNASLDFGYEWLILAEENAKSQTLLMTSFHSFKDFLVGLLIIAGVAAAGEELLFRGIMQPMFQKIAKNDHIGIITTAFIFSAIHMQFLSFLPRFILGIVLGYLYHYSKNLWVPIVGHFTNNAIALVIVYNFGINSENIPVDALENNPIWGALFSLIVIIGTILYQKKVWENNLE